MVHLSSLRGVWVIMALALLGITAGCGDDTSTTSSSGGPTCNLADATFDKGDPNGNADPFGAKAAGQARAGRIHAADVKQPAHGRQQIQDGDFALVNDKIAVVIEDKGPSDGYNRFGGEIIAADKVGDDGRMLGLSTFVETMPGFSIYVVDPTDVSVMNDGSDGNAAVIRVSGPLHPIPFLAESFGGLFSNTYADLQGAYEYVLEPGAAKVKFRMGIINSTDRDIDVGINTEGSEEYLGFFQANHNRLVTPEHGYDKQGGPAAFVGFDGGEIGYAYQASPGEQLEFGSIDISGFQLFVGQGFVVKSCTQALLDRHEIVIGGPQYDGLREAVRQENGEAPWRAVSGVVKDGSGAPVGGAYVHMTDPSGAYLSRTVSAADGSYTLHAPDSDVLFIPQKRGYPPNAGTTVSGGTASQDLSFAPTGNIHVVAKDAGTNEGMPVRIQVIPANAPASTPAAFGFVDEIDGRIFQEFSVTGDQVLPVAPGSYRVVVSHGYEWEMSDTNITVTAGETTQVDASLVHSVDTTDAMCADFHIHSFQSADSDDPVDYKVRGALADGLDIPVSSEHEWVVDFQPIIESYGAAKWAFGVPSEELTTFTWGHFGVVPLLPKPDQRNNGAVDWVGNNPADVFATVQALPEQPVLIINHPESTGFQGYFSQAKFDPATGTSTDPLWSDNFDAIEVYNDSDFESNRDKSVKDWFSLLNHGMAVWSVGSSDSHHLHNGPVGYPRTCLHVGTDDPQALTVEDVRDTAGKGQATISGGLYMTVTGPSGALPGDILAKQGSADFSITVEAPGWIDTSAATLETIVDGETVKTEPLLPVGTGPSKKFANQVTVTFDTSKERNWVVFHAKTEGDLAPLHPGRKAFAASNPVLFQ